MNWVRFSLSKSLWPLVLQSRSALSLLGYCYYQMQDFVNASDCYEQLSIMHPEIEEYKLYYAQALHKACLYQEAMKVACQIDNPTTQGEVRHWTLYRWLKCVYVLNLITLTFLLWSVDTCQSWVWAPSKAPVVSLSKNFTLIA